MRKKIGLFVLSLAINQCYSQNTIGLPDILNYSKQFYKAGAQNRQIRQDKKGILYFANSEGVMSFDGINWKTYPLPNKSIVRSLEFGPDNKLYVGGQDEFGYFSPDQSGSLAYHSLKNLLPAEERSFTDVWEIYFYRDLIFFQTSNNIYQISGNHSTIYKSTHWRFITVCNNRLIAQDYTKGLLSFQNGVWAPFLKKSELPADYFTTSITRIGQDSAILTTVKNGVFLLKGDEITRMRSPFLDNIAATHISASIMVNQDHIALTTNLDGCYIMDKKGTLIQKFSIKEGLQNNNILDIFLDKEKNLWLGLDNGIDFIAYNNAIKHIYPDYLNEGSGYASSIFNNELYIGTSNGLYKTSLSDEKDLSFVKGYFYPVANTQGQVWNLSQVNGQLLMGHHDGAFVIGKDKATPIDNTSGFWTFLPFSNVLPSSIMIAGTYQGINFYDYNNGVFTNKNIVAHFESARFVCMDNKNIWISHPYKGVYRVQLNGNTPETKYYTLPQGVQSANGNYLFRVKNRLILTTETGIFEYDEPNDTFIPSVFYNNIFGRRNIRYLKEDDSGNIWFVFDKILGVLDMSSSKPLVIYFPELTNKFVSGFEHIYPVNKNNIFIGGERGFYHINFEQYKTIKYPLQVQITAVKAINKKDSLLFGGYANDANEEPAAVKKKRAEVSHSWNSFHFEFASPVYAQQANIEYSYLLEGFDEKWSEFSQKTEKEYTNLSAGTYTFKVKVRNNLGNESEPVSYSFTVLPPWYQTNWAYGLYIFILVLGAYWLYRYQKNKFRSQQKRHEEEQKRLLYLHQLEIEKTDKEIVKLKNEKLEAEIQHKNTELASVAMHLVQKGEMLAKIKEQIEHLKNKPGDVKDSDDLKKIVRALSEEDKIDKQWEQFAKHFDNVHSDFLSTLKTKYPALSANELKLSAYLRMNLSTKEMAQLMNISIRGVEISRYRLRKKLGIPTDVNLFDFLTGV
ncbi:MAG TPA: triple tyrosine motif-containing protein [Chitinophagaceae bacterium]|jgi:ligand-binding sensor domain-containing protein/DNA-binding CsgD family transcriptional regulator|nr:triple tyrosine motif-containing protein [Chitinophagaceae bacterium]